MENKKKKVVIIGAGASGIACAIKLKKENSNLEVIIVEQNERIAKKILKTGNGKCNLGNLLVDSSKYNDSLAFKTVKDFNAFEFFYSIGLLIKEDSSKRLYPYSESASSVVDSFISELKRLNVVIKTNFLVADITSLDNSFIVSSAKENIKCDYVVFSTGSVAQEKTNGYDLLAKLNHKVTLLKPSLVAIKTYEKTIHLQGVRLKALAKIKDYQEYGEILFKEDGLSGILSFNLSRKVEKNDKIYFDLFPHLKENELLDIIENLLKDRSIEEVLKGMLPKMVSLDVLKRANSTLEIINTLKNYSFTVKDLYDFKSAQVVSGGISLKDINDDFSSKIVKNLFIVGEVLDIDGVCGGYNLMFAFASGIKVADTINSFEKK